MLVHFYDISSGKITIGGQDITQMSLESLNQLISYVAQEQFLFNTSILENVRIGRPDATDAEVMNALEKAQCLDFIEKLPKSVYTMAGDSGNKLSGGEKQRISLARALLKDASIIILDEATAFIDPENEEKMSQAILLFLMNIFTPIKSIYGYSASFGSGKKTMTALVSPSGGGKSTVVNLLARFWDIEQGEILVRGKNIKDVSLAELMSQISMVFQRVYLFHDTIYNNIAIGCENVTREKVIEAAKKARCYDFIMALPNGFDTVIDEGGSSLSGGERQRISIARCILKDAPIVILDEATASIDADNERYIQEAISELCKGKTLLVIAHRLQTIRYADQIMVISNGQVKERGTHEELMERGQIYKTFVMKKSSNIIWKSA